MRYLCGLITLLLACCALGWADDEERGVTDMAENPNPVIFPSSLPGARLAPNAPARLVELPPTQTPPADWEGYKHPFFVAGYVAPAPPNLHKAFRWTRIATEDRRGQVGVLVLRSAEAKALRVRFSGGRWDPAVELRVFAPVEQVAFVSQPTWDEDGNWWTTIIFGDAIGLEVFVPDNVASVQLPEITAIAYHFAGPEAVPQGDFEPASGCPLLDVACFPDWRDGLARTVCMLATIDGGGNVAGFCSGNSLTRGPSADFAPIIMTARHCVGTQAKANATVFVWFYQNAACNGTPPNPNTLPRNTGSLLLKTHLGSDWTILGAYEPLVTNTYSGWSANYWANNATGTAISHPMDPAPPGGPFKRIAFATKIGDTTCTSTDGSVNNASTYLVQWTNSTIRRGSSGSGIFDDSGRIRGTASCASRCVGSDPKCCPPNPNALGYYGRLDVAYPIVRWYIWEMANPTYVDRAVAGDPNNEGDTERGTATNPFNTVYEGTFCVPRNGTVRIRPGNYNERFRVWRPMRLEREGTSGVVRIGAP
jgi:hypothetical protein